MFFGLHLYVQYSLAINHTVMLKLGHISMPVSHDLAQNSAWLLLPAIIEGDRVISKSYSNIVFAAISNDRSISTYHFLVSRD
jgi:hypothetical protein